MVVTCAQEGGFSFVYRVEDSETMQTYAVVLHFTFVVFFYVLKVKRIRAQTAEQVLPPCWNMVFTTYLDKRCRARS